MPKTADENLQQEIQAVKDDLHSLRRDVKSLLGALETDKERAMRDVKDRMAEQVRLRTEQLRRGWQHAAKSAERAGYKARRGMSERPLTSVLVALAAGALIGRLMGRGR